MAIIPIAPYIVIFFVVLGEKERMYIYTLATFYSREIYKGPTIDITNLSIIATHVALITYTLLFAFGFWTSILYFIYYHLYYLK
jgi:hypothetical protein